MTRDKYRRRSECYAAAIKRLTKQLAAEKRLNAALSNLAFLPKDQQNPVKLKELAKATAAQKKLTVGRVAA